MEAMDRRCLRVAHGRCRCRLGTATSTSIGSALRHIHFHGNAEEVLALQRLVVERYQPAGDIWREPLRDCVRTALAAFGTMLDGEKDDSPYGRFHRPSFSAATIRDLFVLAWRCGLTSEAEQTARLVTNEAAVIKPQRELAEALPAMHQEDGLRGAPAYAALWRHATDRLLPCGTPPAAHRPKRVRG